MHSTQKTYRLIDQFYTSLDRALGRAYPGMRHDDIEDAVQEAMNQYCAGAPSDVKDDPGRLFRWLETIARRRLSREALRRRHHPTFSDQWHLAEPDLPEHGAEPSRLASSWRVATILRPLPDLTARAIWLHDIEGWKPSEIADTMGCSINSINHRLKRGHAVLRRMLKEELRLLAGIALGMWLEEIGLFLPSIC